MLYCAKVKWHVHIRAQLTGVLSLMRSSLLIKLIPDILTHEASSKRQHDIIKVSPATLIFLK